MSKYTDKEISMIASHAEAGGFTAYQGKPCNACVEQFLSGRVWRGATAELSDMGRCSDTAPSSTGSLVVKALS